MEGKCGSVYLDIFLYVFDVSCAPSSQFEQ